MPRYQGADSAKARAETLFEAEKTSFIREEGCDAEAYCMNHLREHYRKKLHYQLKERWVLGLTSLKAFFFWGGDKKHYNRYDLKKKGKICIEIKYVYL